MYNTFMSFMQNLTNPMCLPMNLSAECTVRGRHSHEFEQLSKRIISPNMIGLIQGRR